MIPATALPARPCVRVRSTLLLGSLQALRRRGHADAYFAAIDPDVGATVAAIGAPQWLPIELAAAHYAACDALHLSVDEMLAIGAAVAPTSASGVQLILRAARSGGVTPWTALHNAPVYWSRMYDGSALRIEARGPKDATIVVEGNSLARYAYWRVGLRGIILGLARALSDSAYARDGVVSSSRESVSYSLSWV